VFFGVREDTFGDIQDHETLEGSLLDHKETVVPSPLNKHHMGDRIQQNPAAHRN
jgi:hypothetical protein